MVAQIYQTAASANLNGYLSAWASVDPLSAYGEFSPTTSPYDQWAGGDEGGARLTNSVLLEGDFTYGIGGDFVGTVDTLTFGSGLSGSASTGFSVDTAQLTIDLGGASAITSFDYAIYGLMGTAGTASPNFLYAYFAAVGTEQYGTAGSDTQYSYAGNDTFTGYSGNDTFVFDDNWATDLATDFGSVSGNLDVLDFTAVSTISDVTDLIFNYSNWYDSTSPLTISDGTNTLVLAGYVGSDIFTLESNNQLLA